MTKFNYKTFQNKDRVYTEIRSLKGISKLWIWNDDVKEYQPPKKGKIYQTRKRVLKFGKTQRITKFFETLEQARQWQIEADNCSPVYEKQIIDVKFKDILANWQTRILPKLKENTQVGYQKIIIKYFVPLLNVEMKDFNSKVVDDWIDFLLESPRTHRRSTFIHELDLLSAILNFHIEYSDNFVSPIKKRHRKAIQVKDSEFRGKDLSESDFFKFRSELSKLKHGHLFSTMATVQFFQALRVSEVAAIHWEDIVLNDISPVESRIIISRSIKWIRKAGAIPRLENNFKNSKANGGLKEQPIFEETYKRLTAFSNAEEEAAELTDVMPFLLESKLVDRGAVYSKASLWQEHVVTDQRLVTGQNPASAKEVGKQIAMLVG
ncbi:MAG: hypothetical protein AABY64_13595 [Bdellovibrionota bacterium]